MPRPTDDELRSWLERLRAANSWEGRDVIPLIEELLERRAVDRNADSKAAELRRWNGEE